MRPAHPGASWWRHAFAITVATALAACTRDQPTTPTLKAGRPSFETITALGNYSIPVEPDNGTNGGAEPLTGTGIIVPAGVYFRVRVVGVITTTPNPKWNCLPPVSGGGTYGPGGTTAAELSVQLQARNTDGSGSSTLSFYHEQYGTSAPDSSQTDVAVASKEIEIEAGRSGIAGGCNHNDGSPPIPSYLLSGSQTVYVEQVTNLVHVTPNPVFIHANQRVAFTVSRDDGGPINFNNNWYWQPDPGQPGNAGVACGWGNPCSVTPQGSGTIYAYTDAGNASAHVTVYSSFKLGQTTNTGNDTVYFGDTVTFTPLYDSTAGPPARWHWIPTNPGTGDTTSCNAGVYPCKKAMLGPGTMWAYTSDSAGKGDSTSDSVRVFPTLTVSCSPTAPVRADTITCTAASPSGAVTSLQWHFLPDDSTIAGALIPSTDSLWKGPLVAPGTVIANGVINGQLGRPGTLHVAPLPRGGFGVAIDTAKAAAGDPTIECVKSPIYVVITTDSARGWSQTPNVCYDLLDYPTSLWPAPGADTTGGSIKEASSGPNNGVWYVAALSTKLYLRKQILKDFRSDASAYPVPNDSGLVSLSCGAGARTLIAVDSGCMHSSGATSEVAFLWRHEGCHMARQAYWLTQGTGLASVDSIEREVGTDSGDTRIRMNNVLLNAGISSVIFSKGIDTGDTTFTYWAPASASGGWYSYPDFLKASIPRDSIC